MVILKAVENNLIIGSVRAFSDAATCYIGRLIVDPGFQNRGIGTRLLNDIENVFRSAQRYELFTGYRSDKNLYLYNKHGYREFRREKISDDTTLVFLEKINT